MIMVEISDYDLGWLAGILEGEGCFSYQPWSNKYKKYFYPMIQMSSIDLDVVERVHELTLATTNITERKKYKEHHSTCWDLKIRGDLAIYWMNRLKPYMSDRRKRKIDNVLLKYANPEPLQ